MFDALFGAYVAMLLCGAVVLAWLLLTPPIDVTEGIYSVNNR